MKQPHSRSLLAKLLVVLSHKNACLDSRAHIRQLGRKPTLLRSFRCLIKNNIEKLSYIASLRLFHPLYCLIVTLNQWLILLGKIILNGITQNSKISKILKFCEFSLHNSCNVYLGSKLPAGGN